MIFVAVAPAAVGLLLLPLLPLSKGMKLIPNVATAVFVNGVSLIILV